MSPGPAIAGLCLMSVLWACKAEHPGPSITGDPEAGRAALQAHDCGVCHRIPGVRGAVGLVGPPLEGFGNRIYITGRFANTETMLTRWIVDPPALVPATAMPSVGVDEQDARNMAAYLLRLR
jgi:cytochrome c2